jgi:hypothetical protein
LSSSARCSPSGWTSGREALDFGPGADFRGAGMSGIWGDSGVLERDEWHSAIGNRCTGLCLNVGLSLDAVSSHFDTTGIFWKSRADTSSNKVSKLDKLYPARNAIAGTLRVPKD